MRRPLACAITSLLLDVVAAVGCAAPEILSSTGAGGKWFCPCMCTHSATPFTHGAEHYGCRVKSVVCPIDSSTPRHRFMCSFWHAEQNFIGLPTHHRLRVLHFAPEESILVGLGLAGSSRVAQYVVADYLHDPMKMVPKALRPSVTARKGLDLQSIGFPDEHFDVVIASRILEHVPDDERAMREVRDRRSNSGRTPQQVRPFC